MPNPKVYILPGMDTNDLFAKLGYVPAMVRITNLNDGTGLLWAIAMGNDACLTRAAAGDHALATDKGIKLVKFTARRGMDESSDPEAVEVGRWQEANGIQITADATFLADDKLMAIEVFPMEQVIVRAVHDGDSNSNSYLQDSSIDFEQAGVSAGWIVYNQSNGNYAYVGSITKPSGYKNACRVNTVDSNGDATTAADFDAADVVFLYSPDYAAYPMSDIGAMT